MKLLSTVIFASLFSFALAGHAKLQVASNMDWDQLANDPYVEIQWPQIMVGEVTTPINNVCSNGMGLSTIQPVMGCMETTVVARYVCYSQGEGTQCESVPAGYQPRSGEDYREETQCTKYGPMSAVTETREYQTLACVDANGNDAYYTPNGEAGDGLVCKGTYKMVSKEIPLSYNVEVIRAGSENSEGGPQVVAEKVYTIDDCNHQ